MNKEKILLEVLNEHGDFKSVRSQFDENDLTCIFESMERYKREQICYFFKFFRDNGEANIGMTIEQFVDAYISHNSI